MILITGASGNVGGETLKQAAAERLPLRAAYQSREKAQSAPRGVDIVLLDYARPETIRPALKGIATVFLVSPAVANLAELEANVVGECGPAGVTHIVKLSALGGRQADFPSLHRDSEERIEGSGVPYTILRPNGFMQNVAAYYGETIRSQGAFYAAQGDGAVSHIDVRDIAAAAVKVLSGRGHEGKTYALTGPEALTNEQIAQILSRVAGREIKYVNLLPAEVKKAMLAAGIPEWSADAVLDLQRLYREGKASQISPDVAELTSRKPRSFEEYARDHEAAWRAQR
jgi:uncharacterized protein YbjT (DUF2867 family)